MNQSLFKQKKFFLLVFFLVLLPIIYYSVYEISSLNENEQMIQEVYQHQMNMMLYSVNKSAWDTCNDWISKLSQIVGKKRIAESDEALSNFLEKNTAIKMLMISDTLFLDPVVVSTLTEPPESEVVEKIIHEIKGKKDIISKLYSRLQINYRKIESLNIDGNQALYKEHVILLSLISEENPRLVVLLISTDSFINHILRPATA